MSEYHVACGMAGIYDGVLKPNGEEWKSKTCVTKEAIEAVAQYFVENNKAIRFSYHGKRFDMRCIDVSDD